MQNGAKSFTCAVSRQSLAGQSVCMLFSVSTKAAANGSRNGWWAKRSCATGLTSGCGKRSRRRDERVDELHDVFSRRGLLREDPFEGADTLFHDGAVQVVVGFADKYLFPLRGARTLFRGQEFLEYLLAGSDAGHDYGDLLVRFIARKADELVREVDDLHGLAHVENEYLAARANRARLHHEERRLGNGHKVTGHVGVRDGYGTPVADLLLEERHHAAARTQNVSEAHRDETGVALGV